MLKKITLAATAAVAFVSCSKKEAVQDPNIVVDSAYNLQIEPEAPPKLFACSWNKDLMDEKLPTKKMEVISRIVKNRHNGGNSLSAENKSSKNRIVDEMSALSYGRFSAFTKD